MKPSFASSLLSLSKSKALPVQIIGGPFRGASLILNPKTSKRKILGVYEHILNPWLEQILPSIEVVWDVGANDGYFTYGCAHTMIQFQRGGNLIAFEPGLSQSSDLTQPSQWEQYKSVKFEFLPHFVGSATEETRLTLDKAYQDRPELHSKLSLVKVDVEGEELEVLEGGSKLLETPNHWVVEVHGDHLIDPVLKYFSAAQRAVIVIPYDSHWLLGPESRTITTTWVVTQP